MPVETKLFSATYSFMAKSFAHLIFIGKDGLLELSVPLGLSTNQLWAHASLIMAVAYRCSVVMYEGLRE